MAQFPIKAVNSPREVASSSCRGRYRWFPGRCQCINTVAASPQVEPRPGHQDTSTRQWAGDKTWSIICDKPSSACQIQFWIKPEQNPNIIFRFFRVFNVLIKKRPKLSKYPSIRGTMYSFISGSKLCKRSWLWSMSRWQSTGGCTVKPAASSEQRSWKQLLSGWRQTSRQWMREII